MSRPLKISSGFTRLVVALSLTQIFPACDAERPGPANAAGGAPAVPTADSRGIVVLGPPADVPGLRPLGPSPYGKPCNTDAECAAGLTCLTEDGTSWVGGGPPNGYCSEACDEDPGVCRKRDRAATCLAPKSGIGAFCFQGCVLGDPEGGKCRGRTDVACSGFGFSNACVPLCAGDWQCSAGRYCDPSRGVCVTQEPQGDPPGAACDITQFNDTCAGDCAGSGTGLGVCNGLCSLGVRGACNVPPGVRIEPGQSACVTFDVLDGLGDLGLCVQTCACDADCLHPDATCQTSATALPGEPRLCLFEDAPDAGRALTCGGENPSDAGMSTP